MFLPENANIRVKEELHFETFISRKPKLVMILGITSEYRNGLDKALGTSVTEGQESIMLQEAIKNAKGEKKKKKKKTEEGQHCDISPPYFGLLSLSDYE